MYKYFIEFTDIRSQIVYQKKASAIEKEESQYSATVILPFLLRSAFLSRLKAKMRILVFSTD